MIRTVKRVKECVCRNCGIRHLLGETFQGQRCCNNPNPRIIGYRDVPMYVSDIEEEKAEVIRDMKT